MEASNEKRLAASNGKGERIGGRLVTWKTLSMLANGMSISLRYPWRGTIMFVMDEILIHRSVRANWDICTGKNLNLDHDWQKTGLGMKQNKYIQCSQRLPGAYSYVIASPTHFGHNYVCEINLLSCIVPHFPSCSSTPISLYSLTTRSLRVLQLWVCWKCNQSISSAHPVDPAGDSEMKSDKYSSF